ncbi:MAG: virulence factor SrfB [Pseudomonadota bacterium]
MLAELTDWGEHIKLVPNSGIQFVDFAFDLSEYRRATRSFIERPTDQSGGAEHVRLLRVPDLGDDEDLPAEFVERPGDVSRDVNSVQALEVFLEKWVPVPFLRVKDGQIGLPQAEFDHGPTNWARARVVELPDRERGSGPSHRVVLAFDTSLEEQRPNRPYVAPMASDATGPTEFRFASEVKDIGWFFSDERTPEERESIPWFQEWVNMWLMSQFSEFMQRRNPRVTFRPEDMEYRLEHWMRYIAFLETLAKTIDPPNVRLIDTISRDPQTHRPKTPEVSVDLVLDIGNSRTCGLLIESFPNDKSLDLGNAMVLQMRDLGKPEHVYSEPFSSQVELAQPKFGRHDLSRRSARNKAFYWPSIVRVGPETVRLRGANDGTGAITGMSSPKRYLWDGEPVDQPWSFQPSDYSTQGDPPPIFDEIRFKLNRAGDVLQQIREETRNPKPERMQIASDLTYSRSSFFTFLLMEIVAQAIAMVNAPGVRERRLQKDSPRQINRLVLSIPPATTIQEQQIMRSRVEGALRLVWQLMGWEDEDGKPLGGEAANSIPRRPSVRLNLDEASCTHFTWLFGEITQKFNGAATEFAKVFGKPRPFAEPDAEPAPGTPAQPSIRVASIDVGGGTTDLMITTYYVEANRALKPTQNFREGFRCAGDDLSRAVIEQMVLPAIEDEIINCGVADAKQILSRRLGGDRAGIPEQEKHLRRQFALKILQPVAIAILSACEGTSPHAAGVLSTPSIEELLGEDARARVEAGERAAPAHLLAYLEDEVNQRSSTPFLLENTRIPIDLLTLRNVVDIVLGDIADNLTEAVNAFDADVLLLSGRPSRLPPVVDLFLSRMPVEPQRIVSLGDYRTEIWYPFRTQDNARIADPKTCTAVGGMLCVMAERQIENFALYTNRLMMRSTARFIGELEQTGQMLESGVLFSDVNLDEKSKDDGMEAELQYFAPMRIGFRQLPFARWTTTPLYRLELVATKNFSTEALPFTLTLARADVFDDPDETDASKRMEYEAGREQFSVVDAIDAQGRPRKAKTDFRLSLCTLPMEEGYWLDTGIFTLS